MQISAAAATQAQKNAKCESTVVDFVRKDRGKFVVVSDDQLFLSLLRNVGVKYLGLDPGTGGLGTPIPFDEAMKAVNEVASDGGIPFLLIERKMNGQDSSPLVRQLKAAYPDLLVTVLTTETNRQRIMFLHEVGVDNFIIKPVSAQTLIERMAHTIRPPDAVGMLVEQAKTLLREGEAEQAKAIALKLLQARPGHPAGLMVLGDAELGLGNMDAAREAFQEAATKAELFLDPLRRLASMAEREGDLEGCLEYLERLDELSPLNYERKVSMGEISLNLGKPEQAEKLFDTAMSQVVKEAMSQIGNMAERIAIVYSEKDPAKAEVFLRKAINAKKDFLTRDDLRIFNQLGVSLRRQGRWQDAIKEYRRALSIADDEVTLHYNMGMAYSEGGMYRDARLCMDNALKLDDQLPYASPTVAYNIGMTYLRCGVRDKARQCFATALELSPDMEKAKEAMASL